MINRQLLVRSIEIVTFLFAAFSGFLKNVAPPEEDVGVFAVGVASVLTLCISLLLSNYSRKKPAATQRRFWVKFGASLAVLAAGAAIIYFYNLDRLTFLYPPENPHARYIAGTRYTPEAAKFAIEGLGPGLIVAKFGGIPYRDQVWTAPSILAARLTLISNYLFFVLSLAGAIFSLVEIQAVPRSYKAPA